MPDYNCDGPHSPEQTRAAADDLAGLVRYLNHATMPGQDGLSGPEDVYAVLGSLSVTAARMRQLCDRMGAYLKAEGDAGHLADRSQDDAALWARVVASDLLSLGTSFDAIAYQLGRRQEDLAGMYRKDKDHE